MESTESKWINYISNLIEVNSIRLGNLQIMIHDTIGHINIESLSVNTFSNL